MKINEIFKNIKYYLIKWAFINGYKIEELDVKEIKKNMVNFKLEKHFINEPYDIKPFHKTEVHPNLNHITIHINKKICDCYICDTFIKQADMKQKKLYDRLMIINGVSSISFNNFEVSISKGVCFNWTSILPEILNTIYEILYQENKNYTTILPGGYEVFKFFPVNEKGFYKKNIDEIFYKEYRGC